MAEENKDQKTEEASTKRLRQTEERGQFSQSREMTSAFVLMFAILGFSIAGRESSLKVMAFWRHTFGQVHAVQVNPGEMQKLLVSTVYSIAEILAPLLLLIMLGGVLANLIQTGGFKFSLHPLQPNFGKLNPLKGFARIFSKNSLGELVKSIFKVWIVSVVVYYTIKDHFDMLPALMEFSVGQILAFMGEVGLEIMIKVLLIMIVLAAADFSFQKFLYLENLKMTKQEVKDERKDTEGNPQVKQRIRTAQLQMARRRMMAAVPQADVVVTNPTHISVAIKYDNSRHEAPVVVAKGEGNVAFKIREIAREHNIPLVEDKPLARALNKTVDIGQYIPASLYKAVAEILAYVYKLKRRPLV